MQFETIYKIYNALLIVVCEITWIIKTDFNVIGLILSKLQGSIALLLAIIEVCFDAWNIHFSIKLIGLITALISVVATDIEFVTQRTSDDYDQFTIPGFERVSNGYYSQIHALHVLSIFLLKQAGLLIYYNCKLKCNCNCKYVNCHCDKGKTTNKALSISQRPIIKWQM